ncbi:MAG: hypothetical protein ACMG6E_04430 [Candidatus Roizmanbacteria bacterium]
MGKQLGKPMMPSVLIENYNLTNKNKQVGCMSKLLSPNKRPMLDAGIFSSLETPVHQDILQTPSSILLGSPYQGSHQNKIPSNL